MSRVLFFLMLVTFTTAMTEITREELLDNACELKANVTLQEHFKESVRKRLSISSGKIEERYPSDPIGTSILLPCYDFDCSDIGRFKRDPFDITWCFTIWHPTELIEVCLNTSWNYSTPIAAKLGILDNLEIVRDCKFFYHGCLKVKSIEPYYNEAYFTCHVQTENCFKETFTSLTVSAPTTTLPKLIENPDSPQYLEYGQNVTLKCVYSSISSNYFTSWTNSTNNTLHVIEEDPFCVPEPNVSLCYEDLTATKRKSDRIRVYRTHEAPECLGKKDLSVNYLFINDLQPSDGGIYNCYAELYYIWGDIHGREYYPIEVIPVLPVKSPTLIELTPSIFLDNVNMSLTCTVHAGIGAQVYWVTPSGLKLFLEEDIYDDMYIIGDDNFTGKYEVILTRTLQFNVTNLTKEFAGTYKCIVNDTGYPGKTIYQEYNVSLLPFVPLLHFVSSTVIPLSSSSIVVPTPTLRIKPSKDNMELIVIFSVSVSTLLFIALIVSLMVAMVICHKYQMKQERMSFRGIHNNTFMRQDSLKMISPSPITGKCTVNNRFFAQLNRCREITRDQLLFMERLGEGRFGQVRKANITGNIVAVKTVKDCHSLKDEEDMREELNIMCKIRPHANIINLLGYCTTSDGPVCLVMEYAEHGNLYDFLKKCLPTLPHTRLQSTHSSNSSCSSNSPFVSRHTPLNSLASTSHLPLSAQTSLYSNATTHTYIHFPTRTQSEVTTPPCISPTTPFTELATNQFDSFTYTVTTLSPLAHQVLPLVHNYINVPTKLNTRDLHNFALQIVSGLEHLNNMKVIHCDLAARNILITRDHVLKISDFGMAKVLGEKNYHRRNPKDRVPVRWTAPEALEKWIYSHKTDIWSYGVLLWEIASYGERPYSDIRHGNIWDEMTAHLKAGKRLSQPADCSDKIYDIMMKCWNIDSEKRPTASDLVNLLSQKSFLEDDTLSSGSDDVYLDTPT